MISRVAATVGRSAHGIDFSSVDSQPVFIVVLLLSPQSQPERHLQAMNAVYQSLQNDMFRRFLRQSTTRRAIEELLDEADENA